MSSSQIGQSLNATEKWQSLCDLYKIPVATVADQLNSLAEKIKLPTSSPVWDQVILALTNRKANGQAAQAALENLKTLSGTPALNELSLGMSELQGRFLAIFAAQDFDGVLHFYGHGKEMAQDPSNLIRSIVGVNDFGMLLSQTLNALGAAHDIIQGLQPMINEMRSAEIFVNETQKMINDLIAENQHFTPETVKALKQFSDKAIPFLAEECIVNATYLVFDAGKRDFDNILMHVNNVFEQATPIPFQAMEINRDLAAMKLAITLSDTRRSEIKSVLRQLVSLNTILSDPQKIPVLEKLLVSAKIVKPGEKISELSINNPHDLKKLMQIEGFLLRLGQNIRLTAELAVHFKKDPERKELISDIRANKETTTDFIKPLESFLASIEGDFGEAKFAEALGAIDKLELSEQISKHNLEIMVNPDNFDFYGWDNHATHLTNMKAAISELNDAEKSELGKLMFTIAAKSPGHKVGQETYSQMIEYREEALHSNPKLLTRLDANLAEIAAADPTLTSTLDYTNAPLGDITRHRFYSDPNLSPSSQSVSPMKILSPAESKESLPPMGFEISNPVQRKGSLEKKDIKLPSVHQSRNGSFFKSAKKSNSPDSSPSLAPKNPNTSKK